MHWKKETQQNIRPVLVPWRHFKASLLATLRINLTFNRLHIPGLISLNDSLVFVLCSVENEEFDLL